MAAGIEIVGYRSGQVLMPWGEAAEREFEGVPQNKRLLVTLHQARNPEHHARLWAIYQRIADFSDKFDTAEDVSDWVKLRLRMVKSFKDWDGRIVFRPASISFAAMDQIKFNNFYDRAMCVLAEHLGFSPDELLPPRKKRKDAA